MPNANDQTQPQRDKKKEDSELFLVCLRYQFWVWFWLILCFNWKGEEEYVILDEGVEVRKKGKERKGKARKIRDERSSGQF